MLSFTVSFVPATLRAVFNEDRIRVTHVGSLARPPELQEYLRAYENGEAYDEAAFEECLRRSVADVVRQQHEIGIDVVSDGEFGKTQTWAWYIRDRLDGLRGAPAPAERSRGTARPVPPGRGPSRLRGLLRRLLPPQPGRLRRARARPVRLRRPDPLHRPATALAARHRRPEGGAWRRPACRTASCRSSRRRARCRSGSTSTTTATRSSSSPSPTRSTRSTARSSTPGLYVQIDDAYMATMYDNMVPPGDHERLPRVGRAARRGAEPRAGRHPARARRATTCAGAAGTGRTAPTSRCARSSTSSCGSRSAATRSSRPTRATSTSGTVWRDVELPDDRVLLPGLISHATNVLEHPELVAQRIVRLAELVGPGARHRQHRLRLRPDPVHDARAPEPDLGEARGAGRGRAPRDCGVVELGPEVRRHGTTSAVGAEFASNGDANSALTKVSRYGRLSGWAKGTPGGNDVLATRAPRTGCNTL